MGRPHRSGRCRWASAPSLWGAAAACRHRRGAPALSMRGDGGGSSGGGGGADPPPLPRPADADDRDDPDAAAAADGGGGGRSDAAGGAFVVDMDALRQRLSSATAAKRGGSDGSSNTGVGAGGGLVGMGVSADQEESFRAATVLHVILFPSSGHSGDPSSGDGLYTVQMGVVNVVLAFAEVDDAKRYALMLQALDFPAPGVPMNVTVCAWGGRSWWIGVGGARGDARDALWLAMLVGRAGLGRAEHRRARSGGCVLVTRHGRTHVAWAEN